MRSLTSLRGPAGALALALCCLLAAGPCLAGPREQAKRMHDRLAGVPASNVVLDAMTAQIEAGDAIAAAMTAMDNPAFYNTKLREFATPWSNRAASVYAPLNDTTATVVGMIRDDVPFDQVLYEDIVYLGSAAATNVSYSQDSNAHYEDLQRNRVDLSDPAQLVQMRQSALPDAALGPEETAGIMTTRGFAEAFLVAGTNRAALRFATLNHLCMDMEDFRDVTAWPDRIRQDVTRSPGGDSSIFLNDCLPCHAGLDGLAGGFAFYDFDEDLERLVYTPGDVQPKYLRDAGTFRYGFETLGDSWVNYWRSGPNAYVGWRGPGSGMGAKSLGAELSQTRRFSSCQVEKTFESVCYRKPNGSADLAEVERIADTFEATNYSMKRVFAETAAYCMGD